MHNAVPLLSVDTRLYRAEATKLAVLLEKYPFQDALRNALAHLKTQLEAGQITPSDYFKHASIQAALGELSRGNQWLIPGLFRIWRDQQHHFSSYEKTFLTLSSLALIALMVFIREIVVIVDGKPKLEAQTGRSLMDYCSTGLSSTVLSICNFLDDGQTAVFDMNRITDPNNIPTFLGNVTDPVNGPVPSTSLQAIPSWINPLGWINFVTCTFADNVTQLVGHFYINALNAAKEKVKNAFPIITQSMGQLPDAVEGFIAFSLFTQEFLGLYCIMMQNGGFSMINNPQGQPYGHFDGMERTGEDFGLYARIFGAVYGALGFLAVLTLAAAFGNKAWAKWDNSKAERENFSIARSAMTLMRTVKLDDEVVAAREVVVNTI